MLAKGRVLSSLGRENKALGLRDLVFRGFR